MKKLIVVALALGVALSPLGMTQAQAKDWTKEQTAWIQNEAKTDNPSALQLGYAYFKGEWGVQKDLTLAVKWLSKAADAYVSDKLSKEKASYFLGSLYAGQEGATVDLEKAAHYFKQASEHIEKTKFTDAPYHFARATTNDKLHIEYLRKSAVAGYMPAMYELAKAYEGGIRTQVNDEGYIYWLTKIAETGDAPAQAILGEAFFHGNKTYQDYDRAYQWLVRAAEQNQADAQLTLGLIHSEGLGREKDTKKAILWWQRSGAQGNVIAKENLANLLAKSTNKQEQAKALTLYNELAETGHKGAANQLAALYEQGEALVEKDKAKAKYWREKAALMSDDIQTVIIARKQNQANDDSSYKANSDSLALYNKALAHLNNKEYDPAIVLLNKAARLNLPAAQHNLSLAYFKVAQLKKDPKLLVLSYAWAKVAAKNGMKDSDKLVEQLGEVLNTKMMEEGLRQYRALLEEITQ